jgi:type II secretory pathway pseudopilin PulG
MKTSKALSIVELLVVIGIISILSLIFFPSYSSLKSRTDLNETKKTIMTNLRSAQEEAVTQQLRYIIRFNSAINPSSYSLVKVNEDTNETIVWTKEIPPNLTSEITSQDNEFIFSADGSVLHAGEIRLTANQTKIITISPIGNITSP